MLETIIKEVEKRKLPVYGVEVRNGKQVLEAHDFVPKTRHPIYSATKTFTSTAVGLAVQEGRFHINYPITEYLAEEIPEDISKEQKKRLEAITVERLLTMSVSGYPFRPESQDWMRFSLLYPIPDPKERVFSYSNISAYLVGAAVERAVGEHLIDYLKPRLLEPLGIQNPIYQNCPSGHFYGASGMQLSVSELGRLGALYLQEGQYKGVQILSQDWVREATSVQQKNKEGGYGYFIWNYQDGYRISGKWGQRCFCFPKRNLIVTYLSHLQEGSEEFQKLVEQEILKNT